MVKTIDTENIHELLKMNNIKNKKWFCQLEVTVNDNGIEEISGFKGGFVNTLICAIDIMEAMNKIYIETNKIGLTIIAIEELIEYKRMLKTERVLHENIHKLSHELNEINQVLFDEFQFY